MNIELSPKETKFFLAYLEAIDFTESGDGELDETFYRECFIDCLAMFQRIGCYLSDDAIEQAGHDFWLTRNGHGSAYWDRTELYGGTFAARFSDIATGFGEVHAIYDTDIERAA